MRLALLRLAPTVCPRTSTTALVNNSCKLIEHPNILKSQPIRSLPCPAYRPRTPISKRHAGSLGRQRQLEKCGNEDHTANNSETLSEGWNTTTSCLPESSGESIEADLPHAFHDSPEPISNFIGYPSNISKECHLDPTRLEFESNIGDSRDIGSKLMDDARYAHDFGLWKELLQYRQRHYGDDGVVHIWKGLVERCAGLDLPVAGVDADFLWETFIAVGVKQEWLMKELQLYAEDLWVRTGKRWDRFYEEVVGGYFKDERPKKAVEWHLRLKQVHLRWPNEVVSVFTPAMSVEGGLQAFRNICRNVEGHKIYSRVVPPLWKQDRIRDAFAMHEFLMSRQDGPKTLSEIEPLLKYVELYGSEKQHSYFVRELVKAGIMKHDEPSDAEISQTQATKEEEQKNRNQPNKVAFSDEFGARLFATKALTFELIVAGLQMFGVDSIGPLTLREMALRTRSVEELVSQLVALKRSGISTGESVFSKVVVKLAFGKSTKLLHDVLHSDQHPDVLEDMRTQESLLATYTLAEDWRQVNKTLAVMSVTSNEDPHNHNVLFRNAVRVGNWEAATQQFEMMREQGVHLSRTTIMWVAHEILPRRRKGRRPSQDKQSVDALRRLIWLYQQVIISGGRVPPEAWVECIKRLGMYDLWSDLEKLCLWLIPFYAPTETSKHRLLQGINRPSVPSDSKPNCFESSLPAAHSKAPLRRIFSVRLQEAIVAWGFILRPHPDLGKQLVANPFNQGEYLIPWVRGIILLRQLREQGVIVQTNTIKRACRARLATLFSEYRRSSRRRNRMLRRENPWMLNDILRSIQRAWGKPLFLEYGSNYHKLVNPKTRPVRVGRWTQTAREDMDWSIGARFSSFHISRQ
ncbi:hypothetical protein D8B26_000920 [Coccidioides posadasii str. Silveira]|nr:hypothetical protein CPC735_040590 [Coccidioides posadasii C735 delta SOWgp]EER28795.1 hypothetical protein CPC735_040590 [Coccidioides posadasii C735 delta SOWgp]QVM06209.1 hypothetical protein D8B26_000920 [Coccidioides posadasii str. Silveira]|eukprot:XP_003070940.1 hypothetical protein CPC735_040590 [Coccidioides posadasii C735 delta SOWgp]